MAEESGIDFLNGSGPQECEQMTALVTDGKVPVAASRIECPNVSSIIMDAGKQKNLISGSFEIAFAICASRSGASMGVN